MNPRAVVMPRESTQEVRAILKACVLKDIRVNRIDLQELCLHREELATGHVLPVGDVEYLQRAMLVTGLQETVNISYHSSIYPFLNRPVAKWVVGSFRDMEHQTAVFIKPVRTNLFTGFVLNPTWQDGNYSEHDRGQLQAFRLLGANEGLWVSPVVSFVSEWRYYVLDGKVIGRARYDDGTDGACEPDPEFASDACQSAWRALSHAFVLDIGVLGNGHSAVIELNDAWAIGLYGDAGPALTGGDYLSFLFSRWESLCLNLRHQHQ